MEGFFLYLAELSNSKNAYSAARRAAEVELLFDNITEKDIQEISSYNSDLIDGIAKLSANRDGNVVVKAFVELQKERREKMAPEGFIKRLRFLKSLGIKDPDIDMFIAIDDDDVKFLEAALEAGANPNVTGGALLNRYAKKLKKYKE